MLELALHVLDILQNAAEAGAETVSLSVVEDLTADRLSITVTDDGRGMDAETAARATDPFYTTRSTRHVGLGLPLLKMAAEAAGGGLSLQSARGRGTTVQAVFQLSHPDRQPLGDMATTLLTFLLSGRPIRLVYSHQIEGGASGARQAGSPEPQVCFFEFDTATIVAELAGVPLTHPRIARWLASYLAEGEASLAV